jgi:hypothetical protein
LGIHVAARYLDQFSAWRIEVRSMPKLRSSSIIASATAALVFAAACGIMVRIPAPLNAAGAAVRAKRARRVETACELRAQYPPAEQSSDLFASANGRRGSENLGMTVLNFCFGYANRLTRAWLIPPILDGTPGLPVMRC